MIQLLSALLIFLPSVVLAETYVQFFDVNSGNITGGEWSGCNKVQMSNPHSIAQYKCRVPDNHTLHITGFGAVVGAVTSIEEVDVAFFDGTAGMAIAASEVRFNDTSGENTCDDDNIVDEMDTAGEYCYQVVDITVDENDLYYAVYTAGTNENLQRVSLWYHGTLTENGDVETQGKQSFHTMRTVNEGSLFPNNKLGICDLRNNTTFTGVDCRAPLPLKLKSNMLAVNLLLNGAANTCGRITLEINAVNQSAFDIYFGNPVHQSNTNAHLWDCFIKTEADPADETLNDLPEWCIAHSNSVVNPGETFNWVALNNPTPCSTSLGAMQLGYTGMEVQIGL